MRTLFTLFLFALTAFYASAQSLQVSGPNGVLAPDAVVTVTASTTSTEIIAHLKVANIGNDTLMVLCKKEEVSLVPGSVNMFCWTQCYGPGTYVSPEPLRFDPGHVDSLSFYGEYYHNGNSGTSRIGYVFFSQANPNDSIRVFIDYVTQSAGIADLFTSGSYRISSPYPNPAAQQSRMDYILPAGRTATLSVHNLLGKVMMKEILTNEQGSLAIDVLQWPEGLYFCTLHINGEMITSQKLVVSR